MTDLYAKCPCGSGKKIKFCCRDIISDVERIERMLAGEQRSGALTRIDSMLEKHPDRPPLLALQARALFELERMEDAAQVVSRLLALEPNHPTGLAIRSMLSEDLDGAMKDAHGALGASGGVIGPEAFRALVALCVNLARHGHLVAAHAHLTCLTSITKGQNAQVNELQKLFPRLGEIPAILKSLRFNHDRPAGVSWNREFDVALEDIRNMNWSDACARLDGMSKRILDEPFLLSNLAVLQLWTARQFEAAKTMHMLASVRGLPESQAIEAEACAQYLSEPRDEDLVDEVLLTQDIEDAGNLIERLLSDPCVISGPTDQLAASGFSPPPRAMFVIHNRSTKVAGAAAKSVDLETLPRTIATALVFGKETDRNARVMLSYTRNDDFDAVTKDISRVLGIDVDTANAVTAAKSPRLQPFQAPPVLMPPSVAPDQILAANQQWSSQQLENVWPLAPQGVFDGLTAEEAAKHPKLKRVVAGSLLKLEMDADNWGIDFDFNRLREKLGVSMLKPTELGGRHAKELSACELHSIDATKLPDSELVAAAHLCDYFSLMLTTRRICLELLSRPNFDDREPIYILLMNHSLSTEEALSFVNAGREFAVSNGKSPATWLVLEIDCRFRRRELAECQRLFQEVNANHIREPGIEPMLVNMLRSLGLLGDQRRAKRPDAVEPTKPVSGSAQPSVWTPEASAGAMPSEGSRIWVPGAD